MSLVLHDAHSIVLYQLTVNKRHMLDDANGWTSNPTEVLVCLPVTVQPVLPANVKRFVGVFRPHSTRCALYTVATAADAQTSLVSSRRTFLAGGLGGTWGDLECKLKHVTGRHCQ
jgi:hypothetical protein